MTTLPIVAVGIGNTTIRLARAELREALPVAWGDQLQLPIDQFDSSLLCTFAADERLRWYVASVQRPAERALAEWVSRSRPNDPYLCLQHFDLPLEIAVAAPDRVGMDRLVAAVAVNELRPAGIPAIVVDAGTAVNVDVIDAGGSFRGGTIFPGVRMMARALAKGTDLLPEIDFEISRELPAIVGDATVPAIRSGLFYGTVGAIGEFVRRHQSQLGTKAEVFLTGGDASWLSQHLDFEHRVVADLGLQGVAEVARHAVSGRVR